MADVPQHHHQYLREHMTSSESGNDDEESNGNEKVVGEVEVHPSTHNQRPKKKGYSRHTPLQIQEMESFFERCPHPNEMQRRELAHQLHLSPMQIKCWFQNKHTQIKSRDTRIENYRLMIENQKLAAENRMYEEALKNPSCSKCRGTSSNDNGEIPFEENHLRIENGRPKDKIARMSGRSINNNVGNSMTSFSNMSSKSQTFEVGGSSGGSGVVRSLPSLTHDDKHKIVELAMAAMDELIKLVASGPPIWIPRHSSEILNVDEYMKAFPMVMGPKPPGFRSETSRKCVVVHMNHIILIEILMNVNQWVNMFSDIVTRGMTLEVLSAGMVGNYNGALQVMSAEFQIPSPLVPTRDNYFARYCKHQQNGTWAVVDVSLDHLRPSSTLRSRRRPSGCVIQELPHGYSKVTWVEHVDVDDRGVTMHNHFIPLIKSCNAFGAKRWLASLYRQCERIASAMIANVPSGDPSVIMSIEGRESMLRMAAKMMRSFSSGVGASKAHVWASIDCVDHGGDLKVMSTKSDELGRPRDIVLNVATSVWLPVTPRRVFDFLQDNSTRSQWDILSTGGIVKEMTRIATGHDPDNRVSLLRAMNGTTSTLSNMMILQESCSDGIGLYMVYAPIDVVVTNLVLNGNDPNHITMLPMGFSIFPDGDDQCGPSIPNAIGSGGSVVTISFQILVDTTSTAKLSPPSVAIITNLIKQSIGRIKAALVKVPTNCRSASKTP